jgi:DNA-binding NtrC family response regulator
MEKTSILIVEDEPEMGKVLLKGLSHYGHVIHLEEKASAALKVFDQKPFDLVITDLNLPDMNGIHLLDAIKSMSHSTPVILMTGFGKVQNAVEAMKRGAYDYIQKPFSLEMMEQTIENALSANRPKKNDLSNFNELDSSFLPIITQDRRMKEILQLCQRIAASKAPVMIQGESGTGKELIARFIHSQSSRNQGPFVAVNCASLPETLLESELFGHEKGAFTGAIGKKIGKFELAHHGMILLDEISEMNTFLQAKLLRVLQENEVDRIGGSRPIPIDIRVVATTNRDIKQCIEKQEFREDLYYRLNVINIKVPPLRERKEEIELLSKHFMKKFSENYGKSITSISDHTLAWLKKQDWRGNVRELKNTIERAVLLSSQTVLDLQDFSEKDPQGGGDKNEFGPSTLCLKEMEQKLIFKALETTHGNRSHAAKVLGISIRTLRNKLNEYKLELATGGLS